MYIVAIAWGFVVVLMGAAEAMSTSIVGGILTFFFYGVVPLAILIYAVGTPQRRRAREKRERAEALANQIKVGNDPPAT